jgi:hypothetical protein
MASFLPLALGTEDSDVNTVGHRGTARGEEPRRTPQKFPLLVATVALVCGAAAAGILMTSFKGRMPERISGMPGRAKCVRDSAGSRRFAVCLRGYQGAQNVSAALRKYVIDPLHADLFLVSPESRTSLQAFEPFEGIVDRDIDLDQYFDHITDCVNCTGRNSWRSVLEIHGNWFYNGAHQTVSLMQCNDLIKAAEASRGQRYEGIVMSRLDFMWLQPHPVVIDGCWIPCPGNDNHGVCDHHASCDRNSAEVYMTGKVASIVDSELRALLREASSGLSQRAQGDPTFNCEMHLKFVLDHFRVPMSRSVVAAFRSCTPGSEYRHDCMYVDALKMWGKSSGNELRDCMKTFVA